MKYTEKLVQKVCEIIRGDTYTVPEICVQVGISRSTYFEWKNAHPDFSDAIKKAEEDRDQVLLAEAKRSLMKKVKGYNVEEVKTVYEGSSKKRIKERIVTTKHVQPDTTAIIFTMTNLESDKWKRNTPGDMNIDSEDIRTFDVTMSIMPKTKPEQSNGNA